jgi:glycosyltransferase involved in cell wall biosynthesis
VKDAGLEDRVLLRGSYPPDEWWKPYREIDVAVMATLVAEPLGRIPQEAAAMGVPVIAPSVGGLTEQIRHDVDGLLYPFRSVEGLEEQLERVLREPQILEQFRSNLREVRDTRSAVIDVERFYRNALGAIKEE